MVWFGGNVLRFDPSREEFHLQQGWHSGNEFVMITVHKGQSTNDVRFLA